MILTDSLSLVQFINSGTPSSDTWLCDISALLINSSIHLTFQWLPSHCGITENDRADELAAQGSLNSQFDIPITISSAKSLAKRQINFTPSHDRTLRVLGPSFRPGAECDWDHHKRKQYVQLRSGHTPLLNHYLNKLDPTKSAFCRKCGADSETIDHIVNVCPAHNLTRLNNPTLEDSAALVVDPAGVWELLEVHLHGSF